MRPLLPFQGSKPHPSETIPQRCRRTLALFLGVVATFASLPTATGQVLQARSIPVGSYPGTGAQRVQVVGTTAYMLNSEKGLQVLDVSNPATPVLLGELPLGNDPLVELQVVGSTAYVAEGGSGIKVVDVGNPAAPALLGGFNTSGFAQDIRVVGTTAYVADGESGVQVLDVSNPAAITRLGSANTPGSANAVEVFGTTLYVADGISGLQVLDATNPSALRRLTNVVTSGSAVEIAASGNIAFVLDQSLGLVLYDVTTPAAPVFLGSSPVSNGPQKITISGSLALVSSFNGTKVFDLSGGTTPKPAGSLNHGDNAISQQLMGDLLFAAEFSQGLQVYRISLGITQAFEWAGLPDGALVPGTLYPLTVTSSSALPVQVKVVAGPALLSDSGLIVTNFGTVTIEAENPGNDTFLPFKEQRVFNNPIAQFSTVGTLQTGNYANKVEVVGPNAFVADGLEGLKVLDVRNPDLPVRIAHLELPGDARDIQVVGDLAFLAAGGEGLQVVDVSTPDRPLLRGSFPIQGMALALDVVGNTAYVTHSQGGLVLVDVTTPEAPVKLGEVAIPGESAGIQVTGTLAYVASGFSGLSVVDASDPKAPKLLGSVNLSDYVKAVDVVGSLAYVAAGAMGLQVVDVSRPELPVRIGGEERSFGTAYGVTVVGTLALVADLRQGVRALDVTLPSKPMLLGTSATSAESYALQMVDGRAYVADGLAGLRILDIRIGLPQRLTWTAPAEGPIALATGHPVSVLADSGLPVQIVVESGPARLEQGLLTVTNLGTVVVRAENAGDAGRLPIREFRVYNRPEAVLGIVGNIATRGSVVGLDLIGTIAYLASGAEGLVVVDVSNPASPTELGRFNTPGFAQDVRVVGSTAYVADGEWGLLALDVTDPAAIRRLSGANTPGSALALEVTNSVAYVADKESGLQIIDVSDPSNPRRLAVVDTPDWAVGVAVEGNLAYVADDTGGLVVVDVRNPAAPVVLGGLNTTGLSRGITVQGNRAYMANGYGGLQILDVSVPASVRLLGAVGIPGASAVQVSGEWAYVAHGNGVQIVNVLNPENPRTVPTSDSIGETVQLRLVGNRLYLACGSSGLVVADVSIGQPQVLDWPAPARTEYTGEPLVLEAVSTSGLPVQYSVVSGSATVTGNQVTFRGTGRIVLRAHQAGDAAYLPTTAERTLLVGPPRLGVRAKANGAQLYWAAGLEGLTLEGTTALHDGDWEEVTLPRTEANREVQVAVDIDRIGFFRLGTLSGLPEPIELAGWNRDVVLENQPAQQARTVDSFGGTWFEGGLGGKVDGLPANRQVVSLLNPQVSFALQPYTGSNVLWLNAPGRSLSLTLQSPAAYSALYILAHSAGGGGSATLRIHYTDGTSSANLPILAPDWWDGSSTPPARRPAIQGLARSVSATGLVYEQGLPGFSLHQTDVDLSTGPDAGKRIERLEFLRANTAEVTCIFAVSGVEVYPTR